jgi:hypothetical protein
MNSDNAIIYILGYIIAFIIAIFVTRAIFSIPKLIRLQEAQFEVLVEIAKQQGVSAEILQKIHTSNELSARAKTNEEKREELKKAQEPMKPTGE